MLEVLAECVVVNGDNEFEKAKKVINEHVQKLVDALTFVAESKEIPEEWLLYLRKRFVETRKHLSEYGRDRRVDESLVKVMKLIHQHIGSLDKERTKHHSAADSIRAIANEVGLTERQIRRRLDDYRLYGTNLENQLPAKTKQSIQEGISDAIWDEVFKKEFG